MEKLIATIAFVLIMIGASALSGWIFQLLWNWVIVGVFHATALTFYQAWGLSIFIGWIQMYFRKPKER